MPKAGDQSDRGRSPGSVTGEPDQNMNVKPDHESMYRVGEIPMLSKVTLQGFSVALFGPHLATEGTGCSVHCDPHCGACERYGGAVSRLGCEWLQIPHRHVCLGFVSVGKMERLSHPDAII